MNLRIIRRLLQTFPALLLATSLLLAGCGNKGSLTLPPRDIAADHSSTPAPKPQ